jgi:hypothetical protein
VIALDSTITGIDEARDKLARLSMATFREPMKAALLEIADYMSDYPPPPPAIQGPAFVPARTFTTKAGGKVTLRANKVSGAGISRVKASSLRYVRTGKLGQRWLRSEAIKITTSDNGIDGTLTNNMDYGPYVQGAATQAGIHQGRWQTDSMAVERFRGSTVARFEVAAREALR